MAFTCVCLSCIDVEIGLTHVIYVSWVNSILKPIATLQMPKTNLL